METILNKILADIPLFQKFNKLVLAHPEFEIFQQGTLGANHWRLGEYEFEKYPVPFGRFWHPGHWIIKKHGVIIARTPHYKYVLGLCYKKLGLLTRK